MILQKAPEFLIRDDDISDHPTTGISMDQIHTLGSAGRKICDFKVHLKRIFSTETVGVRSKKMHFFLDSKVGRHETNWNKAHATYVIQPQKLTAKQPKDHP